LNRDVFSLSPRERVGVRVKGPFANPPFTNPAGASINPRFIERMPVGE
jgi:hypothetical protein